MLGVRSEPAYAILNTFQTNQSTLAAACVSGASQKKARDVRERNWDRRVFCLFLWRAVRHCLRSVQVRSDGAGGSHFAPDYLVGPHGGARGVLHYLLLRDAGGCVRPLLGHTGL